MCIYDPPIEGCCGGDEWMEPEPYLVVVVK